VRRALPLLLMLALPAADAADVAPMVLDGKLGARIDALAFPAALVKEVTSGLTNRLYVRVTLRDARQIVDQRVVEVAIRYDLWDEQFTVVSTMNGTIVESRRITSIAEIQALLAALPMPKLFDATALPPAREFVLSAEVLLNPIGREKLRMIRKWVAQNSTPDVGTDQAVAVTNGLFNRLFEQYADGSDIGAVWREAAESQPFRLDRLADEGR